MNAPPLLAGAAAILLSGCYSAPTHYHSLVAIPPTHPSSSAGSASISCTLDSAAWTTGAPIRRILVGHLSVPVGLDRMQLVQHETPTRVAVYETERWATPLSDQVSAILIEDLRDALPRVNITGDPLLTGSGAGLRLDINIEQLDALAGRRATARARWSLSDGSRSSIGTCTATQPLQSQDVDELVIGWSRALADIGAALAAVIDHSDGH